MKAKTSLTYGLLGVAGIASLFNIAIEHDKKAEKELYLPVTLEGKVTSEQYIPATSFKKSKYSFVLDTPKGEYCINVLPTITSLESTSLLINSNDNVKIDLKFYKRNKQPGSTIAIYNSRIKKLSREDFLK